MRFEVRELGWILSVLLAAGGCHYRCQPSCLRSYETSARVPLDNTGSFPGPEVPLVVPPPPTTEPVEDFSPRTIPSLEEESNGFDTSESELPFTRKSALRLTARQEDLPHVPAASELVTNAYQLHVPPDLPGADAPPISLPPAGGSVSPEVRQEAMDQLYQSLPQVATSDGEATFAGEIDLAALQELAFASNPKLRVAAAQVEAARGQMIQAGLPPNPEIGYQADTINTADSWGYHGAYFQKTFVTHGKLELAQSAAYVDYCNAKVALRRSRVEVASAVRTAYFDTLVAREKLRVQRSLSQFTEQIYRTQIKLVEVGEAAAYEPLQLRVFALQSRAALMTAEQEFVAARRRLAAALGVPHMEFGEIVGRPDMPIPAIDYRAAEALLLANHTDLTIQQNNIVKARRLLELARVTPKPNLNTGVVVQYDDTTNPGATTVNLQVGGPIPWCDRNQGNIVAAQARLHEAQCAVDSTRNDLIARLSEAYGRYESNRQMIATFQPESLRDQVRTYRGIYERYRTDSEGVPFNDVVVAQQTLTILLNQYLDLLGNQWQAIVDVANILQVEDIFLLGETLPVAEVPELSE